MVGYEQVDPLTFVWSLRPGMKFHNGDPVDSEAVAFSFGRLAKLAEVMGRTQVSSAGFQPVERFDSPDDLTVAEHWLEPNADIPIHRARHYYSFVNPRVVQKHGELVGTRSLRDGSSEDVLSIQDVPLGSGSGPYTLVRRDGGGTRVERWPDYHKHAPADEGFVERGPYITAWDTRIIQDRSAVKSAFLRGELDVYGEVDI
ncbi:MAG: ABC transporter substrate-binding protein [bacterium]|nr:ABC transporter substrate-binding protein [bacterium]